MSTSDIQSLNQIIQILDQKATEFKDQVHDLAPSARAAQKKMIVGMAEDALKLAIKVNPRPEDLIADLQELMRQLDRIA